MVVPLPIVIVLDLPVSHFSVVVKSLVVIIMVLWISAEHCGSKINFVGGAGILGHSPYVPPVPMSARPHFSDVSELSKCVLLHTSSPAGDAWHWCFCNALVIA